VPSCLTGVDNRIVIVPHEGTELIFPQVVPDVLECIVMLPLYAGFL
jgi:hypothetical protein